MMDQLAKLLIRPPRDKYNISELGPADFILSGKVFTRTDFPLKNSRDQILQCSWFRPKFSLKKQACIVYCHGNCGSRKDVLDIAKVMLPLDFSIFTFDFSGSGQSEGKFISLGYYESWDIKSVVEYIRSTSAVTSIVLWGRSMGAAAVMLYASSDYDISLIILDSPFSSLKKVIKEYIGKKMLIKSVFKYLLNAIRKSIMKLAKFDIFDVDPKKFIKLCYMPGIILHGINDSLVPIRHSYQLFALMVSEKCLLELGGGHNSWRPHAVLEKLYKIIQEMLEIPKKDFDQAFNTLKVPPPSFKLNTN